MDLPTYTNIWRIEKRLYKLYDLRLPMPLPLVQIGVFVGVFLPWIILLQVAGLPFHAPWHVVYLVPPGVLTWLATRPVIEGKRLTELLISQVRYLTEARTWARLTPIREPGEVAIVGRVWRRGHLAGDRMHVARTVEEPAELAPAPERAAAPAAAAPPFLEYAGTGADQAPSGAARRPATAQRPPAPSLQPTPHDGTGVVPSPESGARRLTAPRVEPTRPQQVRPETSSRPDAPRPARPQPTAPQSVPGLPAASEPPAKPSTPAVPATPARPGLPARPGIPAVPAVPAMPAARDTGPETPDGETADRRVAERGRPAQNRPDTALPAQGREGDASRRPARQRNISHEPEAPAATSRPVPPTLGRPSEVPATKPRRPDTPGRSETPGGPEAPSRPETPGRPEMPGRPETPVGSEMAARPDAPATPAVSGPPGPLGRHAAPAQPVTHPDAWSAPASGREGTEWPDRTTPAERPAAEPPAARPPSTHPAPARPASAEPPAGRPASAQPPAARPAATGGSADPGENGRPDRPAGPRRADEGPFPATVIPLPHGRHAKPAGGSPAARSAEPQTENEGSAAAAGRPPAEAAPERETEAPDAVTAETTASETTASETTAPEAAASGVAAGRPPADRAPAADRDAAEPGDDEESIANARTDQIVWPSPSRRAPAPRPDAGSAAPREASSGRPDRPAAPVRGRSHDEESAPSHETRPAAARDSAPPAPSWTPPAPGRPATPPASGRPAMPPVPGRPATPSLPPRAPAAGHPSSPTTPPRTGSPQTPDESPAQPPRTQPTRPAHVPAARQARPPAVSRPPAVPRPGAEQSWQGRPEAAAAPPESPARAVRSGPASPVRPGPMPQVTHEDEGRGDDGRGRRRIFTGGGGGGNGDGDYEQRVRTAFAGARRVVVLGCTGGAGQTVTALMLGHTFAQHRGDRIVAVDVNPGPGAMARRTRTETRETLTSLIAHAEQVSGYQMMRRYTSISKSGLEVVAAGKNPVQALDDRDYALAMRTLDRFYSITLLDAAAAVVARVLPYADQIVLVAPASSDAPRAVAMTFEWLDGHGYEDLRSRAVTVINGVSRRSMDDVEQAESVARGRCRALVRIPWDDHLSLDRAPRNELRSLRAPTRKAYIALGGVVAGGLVQTPGRYPQQEVSR
ncbi:TcpE family conjugal transfer membrane protein [Actinoallomurus soli]|uniref:TcpE family conjugal transfer membrane protein n=1 Tax=Actinoallomurus soli TaxID=2952535 RepID=UPI002092CFDA|nr:TcpE family conjugal transfer membrane protein [Actinoallomurus soli]MCO5972107.1 TcpE family conjugal transfer membrane protein [Actinoallomurus soli]